MKITMEITEFVSSFYGLLLEFGDIYRDLKSQTFDVNFIDAEVQTPCFPYSLCIELVSQPLGANHSYLSVKGISH